MTTHLFREFPKAVYLPGQSDPAIVESAEQEASLLAQTVPQAEKEEAAAPKRRSRPIAT